ncbi:MAG: hypothetical protein AAGE96_07405 [Cyanobacteria bacterium P01_G01_bin.19]
MNHNIWMYGFTDRFFGETESWRWQPLLCVASRILALSIQDVKTKST